MKQSRQIRDLHRRWQALPIDVPDSLFDGLVRRYGEAQRHYHTIAHIADCFSLLDRARRSDPELERTAARHALTLCRWRFFTTMQSTALKGATMKR